MAETRYVISRDGAKIAYSVEGKGPALLLVHGGIGSLDKRLWRDVGWIELLKEDFTIITPDIRGNGESDKSYGPDFYYISNMIDDFDAVLNDCGVDEFYYMGWSYGATIGIHVFKNNKKVIRAVFAGSTPGEFFSKQFAPGIKKDYEEFARHKANNTLDEIGFDDADKAWAAKMDFDLCLAQINSFLNWPIVDISELNENIAIYTSTNDIKRLLDFLLSKENELKTQKVTFKVFDRFNHRELISETDVVVPWVKEFLLGK